jgi:spiro-SPASM protein
MMNAVSVLFAGNLRPEALEKVFGGKSAFSVALKKVAAFPGVNKLVALVRDDFDGALIPAGIERIELVRSAFWNTKNFLEAVSKAGEGFDLTFFAWADCPLLDSEIAQKITERHIRYAAEYSYADGWPQGITPELLAPGVAGILAKINADAEGPVERDTLFAVLQKDINAFDIETEISPVDLRQHRLTLAADSRRNLLLLRRFWDAGYASAVDAERLIAEKPALLRTLPAFFPIQVSRDCPQACTLCPYPKHRTPGGPSFLDLENFSALLDKIEDFSGDAVIDLSLWGELALHPRRRELCDAVLRRPSLSLVIETSALGWETADFEWLAASAAEAAGAAGAAPRTNGLAPLSWIVALDSHDGGQYKKLRGEGFEQAEANAKVLLGLFPNDCYVQAVRYKGNEDDIETFYRYWKDAGFNVIIQKYNSFCGSLPDLAAADLSPIKRNPCWHITRDMPVLIDGSVPVCRDNLCAAKTGNAFTESLDAIWQRAAPLYLEHCAGKYDASCSQCDEYYTFNF